MSRQQKWVYLEPKNLPRVPASQKICHSCRLRLRGHVTGKVGLGSSRKILTRAGSGRVIMSRQQKLAWARAENPHAAQARKSFAGGGRKRRKTTRATSSLEYATPDVVLGEYVLDPEDDDALMDRFGDPGTPPPWPESSPEFVGELPHSEDECA